MPELWFVVGVAMGIIVTGFCAVGSFDRGAESVRRAPWRLELSARRRAVVASRTSVRAAATSRAEDAHRRTSEIPLAARDEIVTCGAVAGRTVETAIRSA